MPSLAQPFGTLRVVPRFASALGDAHSRWNTADHRILLLGFHALRAAQQRLDSGWLDEAFRHPLLEQLDADQSDAFAPVADSRFSRTTRDALHLLCTRLLVGEGPDQVVDALAEVASRLRIDDQHSLAIDAFLVLIDALVQRNDDRADENRCITGILSISANDWDTLDAMLAALRESSGRDAPACAWNLESRRALLRGNLPAAEHAARTAVALADKTVPSTPASLAFHTLGVILGAQERHREATATLFEAYRFAPDPYRAQWALAGLSVGLFYLGRIEAAADCCALLSKAENANIRCAAYMTAIQIACRRGDLEEIARLRGEMERLLDRQVLIAHHSTQLCYTLGAVLRHVGDTEGAHSFWGRGLELARLHGVHQFGYLLDVALTTGRVDPEVLGPLPLPEPRVAPYNEREIVLADVERRLYRDRVALGLEAIV